MKDNNVLKDNLEDILLPTLQKNTKPNRLKLLKMRVNKLLQKIDTFRYALKQGFVNVPYPYGICPVNIAENPCLSCGTEIKQNIQLLRLLGYIVIKNKVPHKTKNCCTLSQELKQLVIQEVLKREKLYALRYPFASPE